MNLGTGHKVAGKGGGYEKLEVGHYFSTCQKRVGQEK